VRSVAILLAAGESRRMGAPKALAVWHGRPLITHQIDALRRSRIDECIVVLGSDAALLLPLVARPWRPGWRVRAVRNPRPEDGRSASIRIGLGALLGPADALLVASIDQPLEARLVDALLAAARREWGVPGSGGADAGLPRADALRPILIPVFEGRRGHPPLFHGSLLPELLGVSEESEGLRAVVRRRPERVLEIPWTSPRILMNLNTPADADRAGAVAPRTT
jgi:molybdenum cofactor cytidylyltransferase